MNRTNNTKDTKNPTSAKPEQDANSSITFSADMHFIVTRNTRNIWMDEMYENPPEYAKLPIFN